MYPDAVGSHINNQYPILTRGAEPESRGRAFGRGGMGGLKVKSLYTTFEIICRVFLDYL